MDFQKLIDHEDLEQIVELQQKVVTAQFDLYQLMDFICQKTEKLTRADGTVVELVEGSEMVYHAACGTLSSYLGLRLKMDASLSGTCVKSNEVIYCENTETDPRVDRAATRRLGVNSMICVPLIDPKTTIGVLKVVSSKTSGFGSREINILKLLAGLLSAAMGQAVNQEQLRISEKASRAATEAKSAFLANMSHEIRTPLNGVIGMTHLLSETELDSQQKEYLEIIQNSAESLMHLINDILDFSKIEARKLTIQKESFNLKELIRWIYQLQLHSAKKKGLILEYDFPENMSSTFLGDPSRIKQVLLNLVSNAIKFTKTGKIKILLKPTQTGVRFEVVDSGMGIKTEDLSQMFKPFTQLDFSSTRRYNGTGLGLSICKELVDIMGGQIGVQSMLNHGSIFWFELPIHSTASQAGTLTVTPSPQIKPLSILVVEDNEVNQKIAQAMLQKSGHKVELANHGLEALKKLENSSYDLILMDCQMPELDGYQTTYRIRHSGKNWSRVPIIAMTANAMEGDRKLCMDAGMDNYISKPMKKDGLLSVIKETLEASTQA